LRLLPLGQATALFQSSVIFVTIFSPLMLGERIGIYRWSAVVTGMIGIVLLTNPFDGGFSFNVVFGIGGAMAGAALSILLRRLGKADNPFSIALWYNGTGGILLTMLALTVGVPMVVPDQTVMATLVLLGVVASGLQLCITTAYKFSEAVVVASLRYMQIPLAALVAYLALGETVTLSEVAGGIVVIGSCLFIVWREMKKSRSANSAPAPADPVT
ncbi:MAG: DMT family transporter, partial [Candidatus Puniceispirillaceae bacterium]